MGNHNVKVIFLRLFFFLVIGLSGGCSQRNWTAKIYVVMAENEMDRAHQLKTKVPYAERQKYFRKACHYFSKAYEYDRTVFTFNRIEVAIDACWRAEDSEKEEMFKGFGSQYVKEHPKEYEYGDAGLNMIEMG